jgi:hypothetical protein
LDGVEEDGKFESLFVGAVGSGGKSFLKESPGKTGEVLVSCSE